MNCHNNQQQPGPHQQIPLSSNSQQPPLPSTHQHHQPHHIDITFSLQLPIMSIEDQPSHPEDLPVLQSGAVRLCQNQYSPPNSSVIDDSECSSMPDLETPSVSDDSFIQDLVSPSHSGNSSTTQIITPWVPLQHCPCRQYKVYCSHCLLFPHLYRYTNNHKQQIQ